MKIKLFYFLTMAYSSLFAQVQYDKKVKSDGPGQVAIQITEMYGSYPNAEMWKTDRMLERFIEDGMYKCRAKDPFEPSLEFNNPFQAYYFYCQDMEFEIFGVDQGKSDFIHVQVEYHDGQKNGYREFNYNKKGEWKITEQNGSPVFAQGKLKNILETNINTVKIQHRFDTLRFYFNGALIGENILPQKSKIKWKDVRIFQGEAKGTLGLDKVVLTAYYDALSKSEKEAETKAKAAAYLAAENQKKEDELAESLARVSKLNTEVDAILKLLKIVGNKNLQEIMDTARLFGIKSYTSGVSTAVHPVTRKEEKCTGYGSVEKIMDGWIGLFIKVFESGDISIFFSLREDHFKLVNERLPQSGFTLIAREGLWQYWGNEKGMIRLVDDKREGGSHGGDCHIYTR